MFKFENLLRNEYFPSELPPCFTTKSLTDNYANIKRIISEIHYTGASEATIFSGYKNANARRRFAIPNPYHYSKAIEVIVNNSESIFNIYSKSKSSLTCPLNKNPKKNESYCKPTNSIADSKLIIEKLYQNNLYEIRLDIASFFDSIYTHSIPWAIHTKQIAKRNKTSELYGNVLDNSLQLMNYGQTNGVLVGNAVSRIISEIILCTVDEAIQKCLPNISYKRYVDDYYIYVNSSIELNNIVAVFRQELAKYELSLNENKIQIYESPFMYGKPWVEQMKENLHLKPDIFLSKMIMEYNKYKDISILKYGLKVIQYLRYSSKEWQHIQSIITNIWVKFPSLSNYIVNIFKCNEDKLSKLLLKRAIYSIIDNNINLKNEQEVIWAVWAGKLFSIDLSQPYIEKVLFSGNWLAIIIMLDIIKKGNLRSNSTIKGYLNRLFDELLEDFSNGDVQNLMWTEIWLLAYEADKNKWLNITSEKNFQYARKNEFFKKLRELNIDFYNSDYTFALPQPNIKKSEYVTKKEFNEIMKKLQDSINNRTDNNQDIEFTFLEQEWIGSLHNMINTDEY